MLFPRFGGRVFWEAFLVRSRCAFQSQFEVRNEPPSCKILYFLWVLDATFDTEDHTFSGQKTLSLSSPGHAVSPFRRAGFGEHFGEKSMRISKPIRGARRNEPPSCKILYFLWVLDATFDTEDHTFSGQKTLSLSSPGHAVSPFRRAHFWEAFSVRSRCTFQSQFEVRNEPPSCKILYFLWVLDATFDTEDHTFSGQKTVSLSSPGHAVSPFRRAGFGEHFGEKSCRRDAQTQLKVHLEANSR